MTNFAPGQEADLQDAVSGYVGVELTVVKPAIARIVTPGDEDSPYDETYDDADELDAQQDDARTEPAIESDERKSS